MTELPDKRDEEQVKQDSFYTLCKQSELRSGVVGVCMIRYGAEVFQSQVHFIIYWYNLEVKGRLPTSPSVVSLVCVECLF